MHMKSIIQQTYAQEKMKAKTYIDEELKSESDTDRDTDTDNDTDNED